MRAGNRSGSRTWRRTAVRTAATTRASSPGVRPAYMGRLNEPSAAASVTGSSAWIPRSSTYGWRWTGTGYSMAASTPCSARSAAIASRAAPTPIV